jgi:hypothetical protein
MTRKSTAIGSIFVLFLLVLSVASANAEPRRTTYEATSQDFLNFSPFGGGAPVSGPATITLKQRGERVTDVAISDTASGVVVHTGRRNVAEGVVADPLTRFKFAPTGFAIASHFDFSAFGAWIAPLPNGSGIIAGATAGGIPTPPPAVPTTGSATYQGQTFGHGSIIALKSEATFFTWGDATINADFAHNSVTTSLTNMKMSQQNFGSSIVPTGPAVPLGFDLNGTAGLTGNRYSGTLSGTAPVKFVHDNTSPFTVQGPIQGSLFGPKAQETGGTWSVAGSAPTFYGRASTSIAGSFGAAVHK